MLSKGDHTVGTITQLNESQIQFWQDNGYFLSDIMIEESILEEMRDHVEMVFNGYYANDEPQILTWKPGDPENKIRQMAYAWRVDPVLESSARMREIGAIAAQLMQTDTIRLLMDWLVYKPGIGVQHNPQTGVGWHQDQAYWLNTYPPNLLTARIPLDKETVTNGCMVIIPGSHQWGMINELGAGFWTPGEAELPPDLKSQAHGKNAPRVCELAPGQIMFHHSMTIHGTGQNRTDLPRRSQNIHMMPSNSRFQRLNGRSFLDDYVESHGQRLEDGQVLSGDLFPVIYSNDRA